MFRRNKSAPSLRSESKLSKVPAETCGKRLTPASVGFMSGLFFDTEDGGDMFLRNVVISPNYTAIQPYRS
jgi:hypothetical protein